MQSSQDFYVEQLTTPCLALFTYYIESEKEAIIIDPLREPESYLTKLKERGATLKYIFETHFHADFVSGHLELAKLTGATIVYGPTAKASFKIHEAKDEELIKIGKISLKVLHTPGHTPESSCFLLLTPEGKQHSLYTGDTLFLGEVGRPDLAVKGNEITEHDLAGWLYDSLTKKIMPLDDDVIVYPGHGAGSACGKKIQGGSSDTLGNQKKTNYALQKMEKEEFITILTTGINKPPSYFFMDAAMNKAGAGDIDEVLKKTHVGLSVADFKKAHSEGALIVDTRQPDDTKKGTVPKAVCIHLSGAYAPNIGLIIPPKTKIVLVTDKGAEKEAIIRLARVGYEDITWYLDGGFESWVNAKEEVQNWNHISSDDLVKKLGENPHILDVRNRTEWEEGVIEGAQLISLGEIFSRYSEVPKDKPVFVHCKSGMRSYFAYTTLVQFGFTNVTDIAGGILALVKSGVQTKVPTF